MIDEIINHVHAHPSFEKTPIPFSKAITPWLPIIRKKLHAKAGPLLDILTPEALHSCEESLLSRLSFACTPCFLQEMQWERFSFNLNGKTPEHRFNDYVTLLLKQQNLSRFFANYSKLGSYVEMISDFWIDQLVEMLERFCRDEMALNAKFNGGKSLGKVVSIKQALGDYHHLGRTVSQLFFSSGKSIFYKPKSLEVAENFFSFIEQLNQKAGLLPLKTYRILSRDGYGWEENVEHEICRSQQEVLRYYERVGMLLMLFYLFEGQDIHFSNLIAHGEHPVVIDLETLFHGRKSKQFRLVLEVGLLPNIWPEENVDISGISSDEFAENILTWEKIHTDEMELVRKKTEMPGTHKVMLDGKVQKAKEYVDTIIKGFNEMFQYIEANKDFVLDWVSANSKVKSRCVLRATRAYMLFLHELVTPDAIVSERVMKEQLSLLDKAYPETITQVEKKALLAGDVPYFYTIADSKSLFAEERVIEMSHFDQSPLEVVQKRISEMDGEEKTFQNKMIWEAFQLKQS